jgi:hypothetical protein
MSYMHTYIHTHTYMHTYICSITLLGPGGIGKCDTVDIIAQGASPRPMTYAWSCIESPEVNAAVAGTTTDTLSLAVSVLCTYTCMFMCMCVGA